MRVSVATLPSPPSRQARQGSPPTMRVSVVSLSGRELVSLDAGPSWHLSDVRALVPEQDAQAGCRMQIFFGKVELRGSAT